MFTEKQLELLREGKIPLTFEDDGMPTQAADAPFFERMQFLRALAMGYMRLYNRTRLLEKCMAAQIKSRKKDAS